MTTTLVKSMAIILCALALVPSGAHLMELINKLHLHADDYLIVQQIYRGWSLSGILVFGALLATLALVWKLRGRQGLPAALIAFLCIVGTQVIFWSATYPANAATNNWTMLPENWEALRLRWEYSHAASALLNLSALFAATIAGLRDK